jgi:heat shock protein HslJ
MVAPFPAIAPSAMTALPRILCCLPLAALLSGCPIFMDAHLLPPRSWTPEELQALAQSVARQHAETRQTLIAHDWDLDRPVWDPAQERAVDWRLPDRPPPRLQFQGGWLTVQNLCNTVSASYVLEDKGSSIVITFGPVMATKRLCDTPGLMALEQRVIAQLPQARFLSIRRDAGGVPQLELTFFTPDMSWWDWELTAPTPHPPSQLAR